MKKLYLLSLIFLMLTSVSHAVDEDQIFEMMRSGVCGKEYWLTIPPVYEDESAGSPNFVRIFVTSPVKTLVSVEVPGKGILKSQNTIANDVIEFNIAPEDGQPILFSGRTNNPVPEEVYKGAGIHVSAEDPIVVYVMARYRYTSDGYMAIPVSALGKEYIVSSYPDMVAMYSWATAFPSMTGIVAAFDNTKIRFTLGGNIITRTGGGMEPGQTVMKTLNQGDVWLFMSNGAEQDLSGSKVSSSLPVSVISAVHCANIPTDNRACDYIVEQDLPTNTWGKHVHAPIVHGRRFSSIIRIYAKDTDTKIFRDGNQILYLADAGGIIGRAYQEIRINPMNEAPKSAVISGDKPINVVLYNPGVQEDGSGVNSDPFQMNLLPVNQYQDAITFCTPGIRGGYGFPENYLNLIYETDEDGNVPEDMEFGEIIGGETNWSKVKTRFGGMDEIFEYDVDGKSYKRKSITLPGDGVYRLRANTPFAAYSYGYSSWDSYGYPTSGALWDNEKSDSIPPEPVYEISLNGNIESAIVGDKPEDPEIRSNLSKVVFHKTLSANYAFYSEPFIPGESQNTYWSLEVKDKRNDAEAVISFVDRCGNDTTIWVNYSSPKFIIEPEENDMGKSKIGEIAHSEGRIINLSNEKALIVNELKLKLGNQGFFLEDLTYPLEIPPSGEYDFVLSHTATMKGRFSDSIGIDFGDYVDYRAFVEIRIGEPIIMVSDVHFGNITVGDSATNRLRIRNDGDVPLTIENYTDFNNQAFSLQGLPEISEENPLVINPGEVIDFYVKFKPLEEKYYKDSIVFHSDASETDSVAIISGNGIKPSDVEEDNLSDNFLQILPNPANESFKIIINSNKSYTIDITLIDAYGNTVKTIALKKNLNSGQNEFIVDCSSLASGAYILNIRSGNRVINRKVNIIH